MPLRSVSASTALLILSLGASAGAQAALVGRLADGAGRYQAVYDTDLNITWLADANYAATSGFDADGLMKWTNVQDWIADSRIEIDQARLLVLRAAALMDRAGNAAARIDVSAIKVVAGRLQTRVVDRAIQVFGAMGLTPDVPLADLWTWGRAIRFADGPDEVHLRTVARQEMGAAAARRTTVGRWMNVQ